ncbi:MAG: tRNA (adenosine(37)-N6)-dimethylallyltransferase MiaA [Planctomycetota bacterium]
MPLDFATSCWFLTGPTAAGKTSVGIELAKRLDAEIVSMDSMALYRGMDIGTAKPSLAERAAVPHHLVDCLEPHEQCSLAQYMQVAEEAARSILKAGKQVLFVGGTPLYLKGLLRGIFEGPPADWEFRRALQAEAAEREPGWLHSRLSAVDPVAASKLHVNDARRLIRALEVHHKTGRPISEWQRQFDIGRAADACRVFVLEWPRGELHARIDRRVDEMFASGLVEEVRRLLGSAERLSRTAAQAVGYKEVIEHLEGQRDLPATVALVQQHTRQLAKRQMTWFRSLSECRSVPMSTAASPDEVAAGILDAGL